VVTALQEAWPLIPPRRSTMQSLLRALLVDWYVSMLADLES
jgi:hypothetical protein